MEGICRHAVSASIFRPSSFFQGQQISTYAGGNRWQAVLKGHNSTAARVKPADNILRLPAEIINDFPILRQVSYTPSNRPLPRLQIVNLDYIV